NLMGMDISPDGTTLVVADQAYDSATNTNWVYLVDLVTLAVKKISFTLDFYEGGTFTAAYGSDGSILVTSTFLGSGWVPLRRLVPETGEVTELLTLTQDTMLCASADRSVIGFAES